MGHDFPRKAVIIDIDDTLVDLGPRRVGLFKKHFPHASPTQIESDVELQSLGSRDTAPVRAYLSDLVDPSVARTFPVQAVAGAVDAVTSLRSKGFDVVLLTTRNESLRDLTQSDLSTAGFQISADRIWMHPGSPPLDPADREAARLFKERRMREALTNYAVIAAVGNHESDVLAARAAQIPAVLLKVGQNAAYDRSVDNAVCTSWQEALIEIGGFDAGEEQMKELRHSFSEQYGAWLKNLAEMSRIDVTVAAVLAAFAGHAVLENQLSLASRVAAAIPLALALLALVFAIRSYQARYTSGKDTNVTITAKLVQAWAILWDAKREDRKRRTNDAIDQYHRLRAASPEEQARAHLRFFHERYNTNNPSALLNLRLFELRSVNYSRAYSESLAARSLIVGIAAMGLWVLLVALFDLPHPQPSGSKTEGFSQSSVPAASSVPEDVVREPAVNTGSERTVQPEKTRSSPE